MTGQREPDRRLGPPIAATLRWGTIAAVVAIGIGFVLAIVTAAPSPGPRPLVEQLADGPPDALIVAGLLGMTLIPAAVLATAAVGFIRLGERRQVMVTVGVLALLVVSLVAAALVGGGAGAA